MPRDGSNIYHRPPGTDGVPNYTVESARYNAFTADVEQDLNLPRPVIAGGTGANNAADAMKNLGGELSAQLIVNYNSDPFQAGSFYSAAGATAAPSVNAFTGICYSAVISGSVTTDLFIEARDQVTGTLWVRQKKANVWQSWVNGTALLISATAPATPAANTLWWDPSRGKLFIYYDDGDSKQWVEAVAIPNLDPNAYLRLTGGTMTGPLILAADPLVALGAATKQYSDTHVSYTIAQGLTTPQQLQARQNIGALGATDPVVMRSYLAGLTLSTAGSSAAFGIAAGIAADSTNAVMMTLASAYSKTTGAWAVGTSLGGLDTGAIAANTWYHVHLIRRPDTGVVDVLLSLSATAPTLPANYTQFRRIGSMRTNASSQWLAFVQDGDRFTWTGGQIIDLSAVTITSTRSLQTLTVPPNTIALFRVIAFLAGGPTGLQITATAELDETVTAGRYSLYAEVSSQGAAGHFEIAVDGNRQIAMRAVAAGATVSLGTYGWKDRRGRDA